MERRKCSCPCHLGGIAVHVVPCCDRVSLPIALVDKLKRWKVRTKHPTKGKKH
jgi:hypothetical protein